MNAEKILQSVVKFVKFNFVIIIMLIHWNFVFD